MPAAETGSTRGVSLWRLSQLVLSLALTAGLLALVWRQVDPMQLVTVLSETRWTWLMVAALVFLGFQWLRTARLRVLIGPSRTAAGLFYTLCLQACINKILPVWLGEIVMVWLLRRYHAVGLLRGTASVVLVRAFDFSLFVIAFAIAGIVVADRLPAPLIDTMAALAALFTLVLALGLTMVRTRFTVTEAADSVLSRGKRWLFLQLNAFSEAFRMLADRRGLSAVVIYTLLMWVTMFVFFLCCVRALDAKLTPGQVLMLYVLLFPISILPVKGIGNVGTHEASWYAVLLLLDVDSAKAAVIAFGSHLLIFVCYAPVLAVGVLGLNRRRKRPTATE